MKSKKYLTLITASLLAVAPLTGIALASQSVSEVQAAPVLTQDQLMESYYRQDSEKMKSDGVDETVVRISKKTPYLTAYNNEKVTTFNSRRITDLSSNHGHIEQVEYIIAYPVFDNGHPDWKHALGMDDKLKAGKQYVALVQAVVSGLHEDRTYASWRTNDPFANFEMFWKNDDSYRGDSLNVATLVPVYVSKKQAPIRYNKVITKSANRVRTYKSNGAFSHHYVYKNHTYKVSGKKYIKGRGMCYKRSSKNQYIPVKYLQYK